MTMRSDGASANVPGPVPAAWRLGRCPARWVALVVALSLFGGMGAGGDKPPPLIGKSHSDAVRASLVGRWAAEVGDKLLVVRFERSGRFSFGKRSGEYVLEGSSLKLRMPEGESDYGIELADEFMTLSGGDLAKPVKFSRQFGAVGFVRRMFSVSSESVKAKAVRIGMIIVIVVVSQLLILVLHYLSLFFVYSDWGPLRYVYQHHKNRILTIHSLVLNLVKYIVYFTALGFVLTELGVNYTTYLASLSVFGLAIAFGSQGFVQDIVTGFFIIFEGQFDVGDMVEISGQTGIVEQLGLRMTRLRNYFGQIVVIPNRNISVVANYSKGALIACVDVAAGDAEAAKPAAEIVRQLGAELARQFDGVFLADVEVEAPLSLETGEHFVRMKTAIWPQQQWVIDQQFVPRVRELLKARGLEVPGDRVAAYYHVEPEREVHRWRFGRG